MHQPIVFCVVRPTHISLGLARQAVSLFSSRAAALFSRVSRLRRSTLARTCAPLTKSEEKDRLLTVYGEFTLVVYHLPNIPGNFCWDVNGKRFFVSSHWKIPGTNGNSEKVIPISRLGHSEWIFVYHLSISQFQLHPFPSPSPVTAWHLPALSVPQLGHFQILCSPGAGHLPTPGPFPSF